MTWHHIEDSIIHQPHHYDSLKSHNGSEKLVNIEVERMGKEAALIYSYVLCPHLSEGTMENQKTNSVMIAGSQLKFKTRLFLPKFSLLLLQQ